MNKSAALLFALLLTALISINYLFISKNIINQKEQVVIGRVIDGDTLELKDGRIIRLLNINTPEKSDPKHKDSLNFLKEIENKTVEIEITGTDKYNRNLARVYSPDYLNLKIIELGLGSKFLVDNAEKAKFAKAEEYAIENSLGIWNKSVFYGCFSSDINREDEYVILTNNCEPVQMKDWILKDESRKQYIFTDITLQESESIKINSGVGSDNNEELYWDQTVNVWNDDSDSLYLFDKNRGIAHYDSYSY